MDSSNNSVIICDSPSPVKNSILSNAVTNYRKRLRSSSSSSSGRTLLDTAYESPLHHFGRKPINQSTEDASDVTVVSTPPAKKQKTNSGRFFNLDKSGVVIVADERSKPVVELGLSDTETDDVVQLSEESAALYPARLSANKLPEVKIFRKGKSPVKRSKTLWSKRPKRFRAKDSPESRKSTTLASFYVNDENRNGQIMESKTNESATDVEEIEVVWSSRPNADETPSDEVSTMRIKTSPQEPIIPDVVPSLSNLWVNEVGTKNPSSNKRPKCIKKNKQGTTLVGSDGKKNEKRQKPCQRRLREIVIDGSNVAMGHSRNKTFSEKGLQIVIDYFKNRGHTVKAFLPQSARSGARKLIEKLHIEGTIVFTPSRKIAGRHITPYDDRYILEYATQCDGIVVSSDQYRDLWLEKPQWRNTIENRLLTPTFVGDYLMFPEDPLGRTGPKLEQFLTY